MPAGRPTKYNQSILDDTNDYLANYKDHDDAIPSIAGLSLVLKISRETIHTWAKEEGKEEFSDILEQINAKQEKLLVSNGLTGEFNSNITKLVLGKHGYSDKQELSGDPDKPLVPILNVTVSNKS